MYEEMSTKKKEIIMKQWQRNFQKVNSPYLRGYTNKVAKLSFSKD